MADEGEANSSEAADAADHGHDHGEEIHMPPNSWWPMVTSIGIALSLVGVLFLDLPFIIGIGILVMLGGIVMWVVDARKEYGELH